MSDLMRDQFELYANEKGFDLSFCFFDDDKSYSNEDTRLAFEIYSKAWQASRAVEIELPDRLELEHGYGGGVLKKDPHGDYLDRDDVIESIKSSGYRVKGE